MRRVTVRVRVYARGRACMVDVDATACACLRACTTPPEPACAQHRRHIDGTRARAQEPAITSTSDSVCGERARPRAHHARHSGHRRNACARHDSLDDIAYACVRACERELHPGAGNRRSSAWAADFVDVARTRCVRVLPLPACTPTQLRACTSYASSSSSSSSMRWTSTQHGS